MGHPGDNVSKAIGFDLLQDGVELDRKGQRDSTAATLVGIFLLDNNLIAFVKVKGVIVVVVDDKVTFVLLGSLSRLLGLATTLGAGLFLRSVLRVGAGRYGSVRGNSGHREGIYQALRDYTSGGSAHTGCGECHHLRAALGGIGNAHGRG
jgi:hypothetical protein